MIEQWKDIEGFSGFYQVSNIGKVRSVDRYVCRGIYKKLVKIPGVLLLPHIVKGYVCTGLNINDKRFGFSVHRLVAKHFIPNPEGKPTVNHKDGDKLNNCVDNLEWATQAEQVQHSYRTGLQEPNNTRLVLNTQTGIFYDTITEAAKTTENIDRWRLRAMISGVCKNKTPFIYA